MLASDVPQEGNTTLGATTSGLCPDCEMAMAKVCCVASGARYSVKSDIGNEATTRPSLDMIKKAQ